MKNILSYSPGAALFFMAAYIWIAPIVGNLLGVVSTLNPSATPASEMNTISSGGATLSEQYNGLLFHYNRLGFSDLDNMSAGDILALRYIPDIPVVKGVAMSEPGGITALIQSHIDGRVYKLRHGDSLSPEWKVMTINFSQVILKNIAGKVLKLEIG